MKTKSSKLYFFNRIAIIFTLVLLIMTGMLIFSNNTNFANQQVFADGAESVLFEDWFSKLPGISGAKNHVLSITFTDNPNDIPTSNLYSDSYPVRVGASNQSGTTFDATVPIEAYVSRMPDDYYAYNVVVYSQNVILAPANCQEFFADFKIKEYNGKYTLSINLKNFNTRNTTNMAGMFLNSHVSSLNLKNCTFVTSKVKYMSYMFCSSTLRTVDLDFTNFNTSQVVDMSYMFYGTSAQSIGFDSTFDIKLGSSFNTQSVQYMSYMFGNYDTYGFLSLSTTCTKINLNSTSFNTSRVVDMSHMFEFSGDLNELTLGTKFITSSVTDMSYMFCGCKSLKNLNLASADFNTSKVTDMSYMFAYTGFTSAGTGTAYSLNFGNNFSIERVQNLTYMFSKHPVHRYSDRSKDYSPSLTSIDMSKWILKRDYILDFDVDFSYMFFCAGNLQSVDFGDNFTAINVTNMTKMFDNCISLVSVNFGNSFNVENVVDMSHLFRNCINLKNVEFGQSFVPTNVVNFSYMFFFCQSIVSINFSYFAVVEATNMSYMFYNCISLTSLDLRTFNTENVTDMSYMFANNQSNKSNLSNLTLNFDTRNVVNMQNMFQYCNSLTSLELSSFSTSKVKYMQFMFDGCSSLRSIGSNNYSATFSLNLGNSFFTHNVENMAYMFNGCSGASVIELSYFNTSNVSNMTYMFANCTALNDTLDLSNFSSARISSTERLFFNCNSLKHIVFGNSFNIANVVDMQFMFSGCSNLVDLDLSMFNTSKVTNMNYLFANCRALSHLDLSTFATQNVTKMKSIFYGCSGFTSIGVNSSAKTYDLNLGANFDTSKVTDMSSMFAECTNVRMLQLSNFSVSAVQYASKMFYNCIKLESLSTIETFDVRNIMDLSSMFENCSSITALNLSRYQINNDASIVGMLDGCSALTSIVAPYILNAKTSADLPTIFKSLSGTSYAQLSNATNGQSLQVAGIFLYRSFKSILGTELAQRVSSITITNDLTKSTITKADYKSLDLLEEAADYIYSVGTANTAGTSYINKSPLKAYLIPNGILNENDESYYDCVIFCPNKMSIFAPKSCDELFAGRDEIGDYFVNLKYIYIDALDMINTTSMKNMFADCFELVYLEISQLNTISVTDFSGMLANCDKLRYIHTFNLKDQYTVIELNGIYYNKRVMTDNTEYTVFPYSSMELTKELILHLDVTGATDFSSGRWNDWTIEDNDAKKYYRYTQAIGSLPSLVYGQRAFTGWGTMLNGEFTLFTERNFNVLEDIYLVPSWGTVSITFQEQGGQFDSGKIVEATTQIVDGAEKTVFTVKNAPSNWSKLFKDSVLDYYVGDEYVFFPSASRIGYDFVGWYDADNHLMLSSSIVATTDSYSAGIPAKSTLHAVWKLIETAEYERTIIFHVNGGEIIGNRGLIVSVKTETVEEDGETKTITTPIFDPTRVSSAWKTNSNGNAVVVKYVGTEFEAMPDVSYLGHKFLGWFTQKSGGKLVTSDQLIEGDTTLYAHWEETGAATLDINIFIYVAIAIVGLVLVRVIIGIIQNVSSGNNGGGTTSHVRRINYRYIDQANNKTTDIKDKKKK